MYAAIILSPALSMPYDGVVMMGSLMACNTFRPEIIPASLAASTGAESW